MQVKAWSRLAAAVVTILLSGGCQKASSTPPSGVVLVLIDALRADRLGAYGNPRDTSPNMDALAKKGSLFLNAIAPAPWTLPTMATLWTSLYPSVHGATRMSNLFAQDLNPVARLDESRVTLAEVLRQNGFQTAAFVDGSYCRKAFGMAQGFDVFRDAELPGIRLNVEALFDWLDRTKPERFFAYVHTVEVHSPYAPAKLRPPKTENEDAEWQRINRVLAEERARYRTFDFNPGYEGKMNGYWTVAKRGAERRNLEPLPESDQEQLFALYDRGVAYTDYWMGQLMGGLEQRGLLDDTVFIITSDHGDELLDHGGVEHGETFYDEMIRVPLIMRVPDLAEGKVIEPQVGLVDLMPSLLDLLRVPHELPLQGASFAPLLRGEPFAESPAFSEASIHPGQRSIRTRDWKLIESRAGKELYDLRNDPAESVNVCARELETCSALAEQLRLWRERNAETAKQLALPTAPKAEVDEETRERLRALGYHD
jgi:choline-sulfatase